MILNPGAFNGWISTLRKGNSLNVSSWKSHFGSSREKLPGHQPYAGWLEGATIMGWR